MTLWFYNINIYIYYNLFIYLSAKKSPQIQMFLLCITPSKHGSWSKNHSRPPHFKKKTRVFFRKKRLSTQNKHSSYRSDPVNTLAMVSCGDRDADTETGTLSSNGQADMPAPKTVPVKEKPKLRDAKPNASAVVYSAKDTQGKVAAAFILSWTFCILHSSLVLPSILFVYHCHVFSVFCW